MLLHPDKAYLFEDFFLISCVTTWLMFAPGKSSSVIISGLNGEILVAMNPDVTFDDVVE
jgi:hypothetical protein